jgi:hypothetical protein
LAKIQKVVNVELNEKAALKRKLLDDEEAFMKSDPKAARKIEKERE